MRAGKHDRLRRSGRSNLPVRARVLRSHQNRGMAASRFTALLVSTALTGCAGGVGDPGSAWPLEGTHWTLSSLPGQPTAPPPDTRPASLVLQASGSRAFGFSGCNRYTGGYTRQGDTQRFQPAAATRMA